MIKILKFKYLFKNISLLNKNVLLLLSTWNKTIFFLLTLDLLVINLFSKIYFFQKINRHNNRQKNHFYLINQILNRKINFKMNWFLLTLLCWLPFMNQACTTVKTCLHNGSFNTKTCQCECFSAYLGKNTEKWIIGKK